MKEHPQAPNRQTIEFEELGIPHLLRLGKVEFAANTQSALEPHIHPNQFEICYHYDGRQHYEVEGQGFETASGDLFLTYPNELHGSGSSGEEKSKLFYLIFELMPDTRGFMGLEPELSDDIRDTLYASRRRQLRGVPAFREALQRAFELYGTEGPFRKARVFGAMVEFFYLLTETLRQAPSRQAVSPDIARVLELIESGLSQKLTVQDMADAACLSVSHFKRKFKAETGLSPYDCLLRQKISLAKEMLRHTRLSMAEIAYELGFSSSQHFADIFKQYAGRTPSEYRRGRKSV